MKVTVKNWHAIAHWRWDLGADKEGPGDAHHAHGGNANDDEDDAEGDVCGICRVPYEGCCPSCKMPGDDCPLIWGECTHVFHMHCLLKWINTPASKHQCPMDRRPWVTAERIIAKTNPAPVLQPPLQVPVLQPPPQIPVLQPPPAIVPMGAPRLT